MKEIREFRGSLDETTLFCRGLNADNLLAFGVSTDGTSFHVVYLHGRDDGHDRSEFAHRVLALLDKGTYGYVSKWGKVVSGGAWISMVSLDARVSGVRFDHCRSTVAEILNTMGDRQFAPYGTMPVGFELVCPIGTEFKTYFRTSGVSHQEINTNLVSLLPGGHVVYMWNVRTTTPGAKCETYNGTVFATSLRHGVHAVYKVKDFECRRIADMTIREMWDGSMVIAVEFVDLGNAILTLGVGDAVSFNDCQMVQTAPAPAKKTHKSAATAPAFAS